MAYKMSSGKRGFGDIQFEDDADTGIDFEADTIKLETSGSERLVVSNSNIQSNEPIKIRAGSTSGSPLDIQWHGMDGTPGGSENAVNISHKRVTNSTRNTNIAFTKWYNNGSSDTSLTFGSVGAVATGTWDNNASSRVGHINFKLVNPSDSGALTERMRITTDGKVGIGTDSPDYTLDVAGDVGVDQYIYHNGDADTFIQFVNDKIVLKTGDRAMITAEIKGSQPHEVTINDGGNNVDFVVKGNGSRGGNPAFKVDASTNKVGINGVGTPDESLHVAGNIKASGDDARIKINGDTDSHPGLELYENGTRKWIIYNDYGNDNLTFKTNSNTRMSIEQDGDVGIGTTSPIAKLDVAGKIAITAESSTPSQPSDG